MIEEMSLAAFRQLAVIHAMQGLLADGGARDSPHDVAEAAVDYADALIEAMTVDDDQPETPEVSK